MNPVPPINIDAAHGTALPPYWLAQARVLIVDDSDFTLKLIGAVIHGAGFRKIETARDGLIALEKTQQFDPHIVLLDLEMPNLDGFGYLDRARKELPKPPIPIIVQTSLEERDAKLAALACGADDFLNKPLDPDELMLRVRLHLERYFMLKDLSEMRHYLEIKLALAQQMVENTKRNPGKQPATLDVLRQHREVLEKIAHFSPVKPGISDLR